MGSLATVLVILAMIGGGVVLIRLANARHAGLPPLASPDRWRRRPPNGTTGRSTLPHPGREPVTASPVHRRRRADRTPVPGASHQQVHVPLPPPEVIGAQEPQPGTGG